MCRDPFPRVSKRNGEVILPDKNAPGKKQDDGGTSQEMIFVGA
jgi:hypothetical protein